MTKIELRSKAKEIIKNTDKSYFESADKLIEMSLTSLKEFREAQNVFIYVSMPGEPDTYGIIHKLLKDGKNIFVPKCIGDGIMTAVRINDISELKAGYMGIPEPESSTDEKNIDIAVVPCVMASRDGRRLGHGKGFYDRFLADKNITKICLCYEKLINDKIITCDNDILMDKIITEKVICL